MFYNQAYVQAILTETLSQDTMSRAETYTKLMSHLEKIVLAGRKSIDLLPEIVDNTGFDENFAFIELVKDISKRTVSAMNELTEYQQIMEDMIDNEQFPSQILKIYANAT